MSHRIGCICYDTNQGLAYLAKSFYDAGVITDVFVVEHPHYPGNPGRYPNAPRTKLRGRLDVQAMQNWLKPLDALLCFETPFFWQAVDWCRTFDVRSVLVPMYEWYPVRPPAQFDKFVCPSLLDLDYFRDSVIGGYKPAVHLPIPVDPSTWKPRTKALRFLHNAGHVGCRNHKGTEELLKALPFVKSPIDLTIRCQTAAGRGWVEKTIWPMSLPSGTTIGIDPEVPYEQLFADYDVYVAPEKFNGLSLPLQEARAAGLLVLTTDRYPANTWLPKESLISAKSYQRARTQPGNLEFDEAIVEPEAVAEVIDSWYGRDITDYSESGKVWAEANSWTALKDKWLEAILP